MKRKLIYIVASMALAILISGCNKTEENTTDSNEVTEEVTTEATAEVDENQYYPITVNSHEYVNGAYSEIDQTFDVMPERIYCNNQTSFETLLALGVGDNVVATPRLGNPIANGLEDELSAVEDSVTFIDEPWPPKEVVLGTDPDFITGRGKLFHDEQYGHGSVEDYNENGIPTYVLEGMLPTATIESVADDVINYGEIFNEQEKAEKIATEYLNNLDEIDQRLSDITEDYGVLLLTNYYDNNFSVFLGNEGITADILDTVHCHTVFKGPGYQLSAEQIIDMDPDYIFYMDYVDSVLPADEAVAELYSNPIIETVSAIENEDIYIVSYNGMNAGGLSTMDQLADLATQLYPEEMSTYQ